MTSRVNITYPVDALVSYHYYREDRHMAALAHTGRLRLIGDSGAFSAHTQGAPVKLAEYAAWVTQWRPHLYWAASLDVIYDPAATLKNWRTLRDQHGLDTVPTIHLGTDPRWLDGYARDGVDFIGLGGMVGKPQPTVLRWSLHMLRYARRNHPGMRFHAWGLAGRGYLDALPVYSADSSGILGQAYRYGRLRLFDPTTGRDHSVALNGGTDVIRLGGLLRRVYGVEPGDIRTSHPGNRTTLIQLAAASVQQYAAWLQRRHQVTAPTYGINPNAPGGPRVHVIAGRPDEGTRNNQRLQNLWEDPASGGPRVHIVDGSIGNLTAAVAADTTMGATA